MKRNILVITFCLLFSICVIPLTYSQNKVSVYYYGVLNSSSDDNMKTITQDLFLAQIRSIENINVIDSSDKDFSKQELSDDDSFDYFQSLPSTKSSVDSVTISFFAIIKVL